MRRDGSGRREERRVKDEVETVLLIKGEKKCMRGLLSGGQRDGNLRTGHFACPLGVSFYFPRIF